MALEKRRRRIRLGINDIECWNCGHRYDKSESTDCPDCQENCYDDPKFDEPDDFDAEITPEELHEDETLDNESEENDAEVE